MDSANCEGEDMKEKIGEWLQRIRGNPMLLRQLYGITVICGLFLLSFTLKSELESGKYVVDKDGAVVGIERRSLNAYEEYPVHVSIRKNKISIEQDIIISKKSVKELRKKKKADRKTSSQETKQDLELELNHILSEVESSEEKKISLPTELTDGTKIVWEKANTGWKSELGIVGLYFLMVVLLVYRHLAPKKRKKTKEDEELLRGLPRFVNQLVMMMFAGVILSDAFDRICQSYQMIPEKARSEFEAEMVTLYENHSNHVISTAAVLNDFAGKNNVTEMMRISTILIENERRGSDVVESLTRESRFLWEERKIVAAEKGKGIDTKMAGPLGVLLILLIVITMAPAMLAM